MKFKALTAMTLAMTMVSSHAVQINEIRIDQPSSDVDEYFELKGSPNESLDGLSYIVIGDGSTGDGTLDTAVSLDGLRLNSEGLLLIAKSTLTLATPELVRSFSFENSDNVTHALINNLTVSSGDDLDADDDGVLDPGIAAQIIDSIALVETPTTGDAFYGTTTIGPDGSFVPGHVFNCPDGWQIGEFVPAESNDTPGMNNTCQDDGTTDPTDPVIAERTIPEIQSDQPASPYEGELVKTTGVVTADFQANEQLRGFYLQDENGDDNTSTSDGIFVFTPSLTPELDVVVGDRIELIAEIDEFFGLTELKNVSTLTKLGTGIIEPTTLVLPEATEGDLENVEGMLVKTESTMTVSQTFFLGRFGQLTLASPNDQGESGRLYQPTNLFPANSPQALLIKDSNARRKLVLDDGSRLQNPETVPFFTSPMTPVRGGDQVKNLVGVIDYGRIDSNSPATSDYILQPTQAPVFVASNPRTNTPTATGGELNIASFNVLNYFTGIDNGPDICGIGTQDCRGADTEVELARQTGKLVSAISAINADVVGLIEIENNGYSENSAIALLTKAINAELGDDVYQYVTPPGITNLGTDAIAVGFIYKPSSVEIVGVPATLNTGAFDQTLANGRSRQPLATSFRDLKRNATFTAVINHFKSKRAPSSPLGDQNDDQGDGQGSFNLRRTEAANDLIAWLQSAPTGIEDPDVLVLGDLNAYAEEGPLLAFDAHGYTDLIQTFTADLSYTYTFDGQAGSLDHALASNDIVKQVVGVTAWHINTDESTVFDYNTEFNPEAYYFDNSFRSSDHDPVIVGLSLTPEFVDDDGDLIDDREDDLCLGTPLGTEVNQEGCGGQQLVDLNCEPVFQDNPYLYKRCVLRQVVSAYSQGLLTRNEARKIYWKAVIRVFLHHLYRRFH